MGQLNYKNLNAEKILKLPINFILNCDNNTGQSLLYHLLKYKKWDCIDIIIRIGYVHYCEKCSLKFNILTELSSINYTLLSDNEKDLYIRLMHKLIKNIPNDNNNKFVAIGFLNSILNNNKLIFETILTYHGIVNDNIVSHISYFEHILNHSRYEFIETYCVYVNKNPFINKLDINVRKICETIKKSYNDIFETTCIKYLLSLNKIEYIHIILNYLTLKNETLFKWAIENEVNKLCEILINNYNIDFDELDIKFIYNISNSHIRDLIHCKMKKRNKNISSLYDTILNSL